ncbi:two-component system sensor histidine kinase NtrB [Terracidiphilus sp.]|jgi:signal transduction histidine kinase|uniref:two-component system sensor histidine kinase NtrB n=1 Tax=Terracidiphilus sp. TaxID=1964191 RepID=UPI003C28C036
MRPKELSENAEVDASLHLNWERGVTSSERSILDTLPLPTAALAGSDHILRYVNSAFCRLACKTKDELVGKPLVEVVGWEGCLELLNHVYNTGEVEIQSEPERTAAHFARRSYTMWPIQGAEDHPVGVMMQVTETTQAHQRAIAVNEQLLLSGVRQHELRETAESLNAQLQLEIANRERMEQALVHSEKLAVTARFASTMAHEINNPLEAMTNLVYLLAPLQTDTEARAYIATLEDQLQGLRRITAHSLKFHRDGNKPAEFKLDAVLREVSDFYRPQAERQGIVVHQRLETDGTILAFRGEIVQVVTNLLLNALDATSAHGQVILHLYPAPRWLCEVHRASRGYCLSIADSGSGIAAQDRARVYQPFFTTKGERGTGLGLWVSAGIVNRVGGSIRVWSTCRPGRSGTCFSVFLPAQHPA